MRVSWLGFGRRLRPGEVPRPSKSLLEQISGHTLSERSKLEMLHGLAVAVQERGVAGDIVECGTYKGGSAALLGAAMGQGRHLWLYDSFAGMPPTHELDGTEATAFVGKVTATEEDVRTVLGRTGLAPGRFTIRPGWFQDTFREALPEKVALLHCDADWFDSVLLVLETFYPRLSDGGCVVLDDFGYWEGAREAFYEFCERHRVRPLLERNGSEQAFWFKGAAHHRDKAHSVPVLR